jgi:CBS domain-containing protein
VTTEADVSVREVAQTMERERVGTVIVTESANPVGILTDRDIALNVLIGRLDAEAVRARDLMQTPLVTIPEQTSLGSAARVLRMHAARRLPVVDERGRPVGVIGAEDLVGVLSRELAAQQYLKKAVTVSTDTPVRDAAELMRSEGVGYVVVQAEDGHPIGIVTDRDLTLRVVAAGREAGGTPVSAVMSRLKAVASPDELLQDVVERMAQNGVRRVPVVHDDQVLGIVLLDELLITLAAELHDIGEATRREVRDARRAAQIEQIRRELEDTFHEIEGAFQEVVEELEEVRTQAKDRITREVEAVRDRIRRLLD